MRSETISPFALTDEEWADIIKFNTFTRIRAEKRRFDHLQEDINTHTATDNMMTILNKLPKIKTKKM
jgi:hypothetical protein